MQNDKNSEDHLQDPKIREAIFQGIFQNMSSCAAVYEAVNDGKDFIFLDLNHSGEQLDKLKKEDTAGQRLSKCLPGLKECGLIEVLRRVWQTGTAEHFIQEIQKGEQIFAWRENYIFKLSTGHVVAIYDDITEKKRAEEKAVESEAQLSNAMKLAHLGTWEYDVIKDTFIFNDAFYAIFHTTADEVGGYTMPSAEYAKRFVHPEEAQLVGREILKTLDSSDPGYSRQLEHRIIYADGGTGYIAVRFFIVKNSEGKTVRTYGVNQDITERKNSEQEIKRQLSQLQSLSKVSVGRELKMIELKKRIKELEDRLEEK